MTTEQRHVIYKKALELFELRESVYMCGCIKMVIGAGASMKELTEFQSMKPLKPYHVGLILDTWFDPIDRASRIKLLKKCIKLTAPKK